LVGLRQRLPKLLLQGHSVKIYNAEKAVITGTKNSLLEHYTMLRGRRQFKSHKVVSVWYPTLPHTILRYTILRMPFPRKKPKGRAAARRLEVKSVVWPSMRGSR
jgi:large subunit ribosomal protein L13